MKKIFSIIFVLYLIVGFFIFIIDQSNGKRFSETINKITFGIIGKSEEDILTEIGGPKVLQGLEIEKNFNKFQSQCVGKPQTEFCRDLYKKIESYLLKK
jgi:hypothetical protein